MTTLRIAARRLAAQIHRRGDVHFHYDSAVLAIEGTAAHRALAGVGAWQTEVAVTGEFTATGYELKVKGRIDAVDETAALPCLLELKTTRTDLGRLHAHLGHLHWAQLKLYGHMFATTRGWQQLRLRLQYQHLDSGATVSHDLDCSAAELRSFFEMTCATYVQWRAELDAWRGQRDASLLHAPFPHAEYRAGQRQLAAAAFRAHRDGVSLIVEAPTGLGKTAATLFPALQAMARGHADRVLYLSARTTGQASALATLRTLRGTGVVLRQVQIVAKEKVCLTPGEPCAAERCIYAAGHFDRVPAALLELQGLPEVGAEQLQALGRAHRVCPFELSLAAARWADVVVCDYNYVLDPVIRSASIISEGARRTSVLIDEAHQLPDRTREMYSATLSRRGMVLAGKALSSGKKMARLAKAVRALANVMSTCLRSGAAEHDSPARARSEGVLVTSTDEFDQALLAFVDACAGEIGAETAPALTDAYFQAVLWRNLDHTAAQTRYAVIARAVDDDITFLRYCIDPSIPIALALQPFRSVQAFSGTLPGEQRLGLPGEPAWLRLGSPFPKENLGVFVVRDLSVYFRDRAQTIGRLAALVRAVCAARAGNYLVFAPSFAYVEMLHTELLATEYAADSGLEIFAQHRHMDDAQRGEFVARFVADGRARLGIAATGGMFSESVDLAGEQLIGVLIVGVALPPRSVERELIRDAHGEAGERQAYHYPAMIRVLQTAGRLIRDASDQGVLYLIDARFAAPEYHRLLPSHWQPAVVSAALAGGAAQAFWASHAEHAQGAPNKYAAPRA